MQVNCPLGHNFEAKNPDIHSSEMALEIGKLASIRTYRRFKTHDLRLGCDVITYGFEEQKYYLVCPECGIVFRPKE
jgi:hypothetical protein